MMRNVIIAMSLLGAAAITVAVVTVDRTAEEEDLTTRFQKAVATGESVYGRRCTSCHDAYQPRFFQYDEWRKVLTATGCPAETVSLTDRERESLLDFMRGKAAGTAEEAEEIRTMERQRKAKAAALRGADIYGKSCASCHAHALFPRTLTAKGWEAHMAADTVAWHRAKDLAVLLTDRQVRPLLAHLLARAAGTDGDAAVFRSIVASGGGGDVGTVDDLKEVDWHYDYRKGMDLAEKEKKPVLLNLTIEGGT